MKKLSLERYLKPAMSLLDDAAKIAAPYGPACRQGCSGCCRRISVPATIIEAALVVRALNNEGNRFLVGGIRQCIARLDELYERIMSGHRDHDFFSRLSELNRQTEACPFLVGESCAIYRYRPFACRVYAAPSPFGCQGCPDNSIIAQAPFVQERRELSEQLYDLNGELRAELGFPDTWPEAGVIYRMLRLRPEDAMATLITPRSELLIR